MNASEEEFANAGEAVRDLAFFFLLDNWEEPTKVDIVKIRELRDSLTIIDHYLRRRRDEETNRLLNGFGDKCQIRDGHVGHHVSNNGPWRDYELPAGQTDGQLLEVNSYGAESRCGESGGMQLG